MTKEIKKIQTDQSPAAPVAEKELTSLEIKDLRVSYNGLPVLNGIDLVLRRGDTFAIIGESGAGKTTLGLSILGLVEGLCRGEIFLNGQSLLTLPEEKWREKRGRDMAMVFQNVSQALHPLYTIRDQITESILVHGLMDKEQAKQRVFDMLHFVGFDRRKARAFPHQLSGGEKQKALITMALINDPGLLIMDEPTASLDVLTKEDIMGLLKGLIREKMTLLITHDISVASRLTDFMGGAVRRSDRGMGAHQGPDPKSAPSLYPWTPAILSQHDHHQGPAGYPRKNDPRYRGMCISSPVHPEDRDLSAGDSKVD